VGRESFEGTRLSVLGFWSLAIVMGAIGPVMYIYGPIPGWLQSLGVAFSIALFVPVIVIVADLVFAMRGRRSFVDDLAVLMFLSGGTFLFLVFPVQNLVQALRTSSAVVGATAWITAGDFLLFSGVLSFWLFGFAYHASGPSSDHRSAGDWHFGMSATGLGLGVAAMWMGGLSMGLAWSAGVNSSVFTTFGTGWSVIDGILAPFLTVRMVGIVLFALGQIVFVFTILMASWEKASFVSDATDDAFDLQLVDGSTTIGWRRLRWGLVGAFVAVLVVTVVVPAFDPAVSEATVRAETSRTYPDGSAVAAGRGVYVREGCVACHTQSVRPIVADVGLGPVSVGGDYVNETPALIGTERLGPDLMHVGSRIDDVAALQRLIEEPRIARPWSIMPSYRYLTQDDLDNLTEYLLSLR
jgi:cytochrome c oxidase cbb3-type subunit I/II